MFNMSNVWQKPVINCSNCSTLAIKIRHQWRRRGVKAQYPKNPRQILAEAIHESNDKNSERNPASDWVFFSLDFISEINKCQEDLKGQKNNLLLKVIFRLDCFSRHKTTNFKITKQTQGPQCLDMFLIYPFRERISFTKDSWDSNLPGPNHQLIDHGLPYNFGIQY